MEKYLELLKRAFETMTDGLTVKKVERKQVKARQLEFIHL